MLPLNIYCVLLIFKLVLSFECPQAAYYLDYLDCRKYYICDRGEIVPKRCGPGTVFNPRYNVCDSPENVDCPVSTYDPGYCYVHGAFFASALDCQVCYKCDQGVAVENYCEPGTVFNPHTWNCDWPYNVYGCDHYH